MRNRLQNLALITTLALAGITFSTPASAIPAFARKFGVACTLCHSAPPYLTKTGRLFKENGYRMADEDGIIDPDSQNLLDLGKSLTLEKLPPLSVRAVSRPIQISLTGTTPASKLDAIHELEILSLGSFASWGSYFVELETEDEDGFAVGGGGQVGLHPSQYFNVVAGYGAASHADPYNSLKEGGHRLTVAHKNALLMEGTAGDPAGGHHKQFVTAYGRAAMIYYSATVAGAEEVFEGDTPRNFNAHVVADIGDIASVGLFGFYGLPRAVVDAANSTLTQNVAYQETGVDANLDWEDIHGDAAFLVNQSLGDVTEINVGGFVEGFYTYQMSGRPVIMPLVRLDYNSSNNLADQNLSAVLQLSAFLFQNARVGVEADAQILVPSGAERVHTLTVFADVVM